MGNSRASVRRFPEKARVAAGYQLYRVQCGDDPTDWKPMPDIGAGVREIRIRESSGAFRVIYLANRGRRVFVLHGFRKKSEKTNQWDLRLAQERFRQIGD